MNSGNLSIDPELIPGKVSQINSANETLRQCYKDIMEINDLVRANWTGDAATSAVNAIDQDSKIFDELIKLLTEIAEQMQKIGTAYAEAESASTVKSSR